MVISQVVSQVDQHVSFDVSHQVRKHSMGSLRTVQQDTGGIPAFVLWEQVLNAFTSSFLE